MEVEYSGGIVLIFSYLIIIHQLDDLGGLCDSFVNEFIGCRFDGPPIAARLYLTNVRNAIPHGVQLMER